MQTNRLYKFLRPRKCLFTAFACLSASYAYCQHTLKGLVRHDQEGALEYISVFVKGANRGTITSATGEFSIEVLKPGKYEIVVSGVGYKTKSHPVTVPGDPVVITLESEDRALQEVLVEGKSDTQLAAEQPVKSTIVNTQRYARLPSTMVELMNRTAGVRVRQTGGLGSNAGVIINGFQDRAIRYFRDGIPMDYLGAGYNFSLVPINQLERLEIYKGVLPVNLGADALGGGLNLVTRKKSTKSLETSYEIASFNTHRATLNVYYPDTTHHTYVGVETFFNHSDNNYKVTPDLINETVRLFHNEFTHYYGDLYGGVVNTVWADELRFGLTGYWLSRQNQYGSSMTQPFGAYTSEQYSVVPTIHYRKTLLHKQLAIDQFFEQNTIRVNQVDTARGTYDWHGNFEPSDSYRGEASLRGSLAKTSFSYLTSRTYLSYLFHRTRKLELNVVYSENGRHGRDPYGMTFRGSGRDILSVPAKYTKLVTSLGLEAHLLDARLTNNLIIKHYLFTIDALDANYYGDEQPRRESTTRWGIADAIKFSLNERSFVRASTAYAARLPEQDELFGDGNLHVANFELKPEKSMNVNAGYYRASNTLVLEVNAFYRHTRDLILNVPYNFLFNQNQNIENVRGIGFETDALVHITPWLKVNGNFTYQDFRLFNTGNVLKEGSRLQNTPYFFANLGLQSTHQKIFGNGRMDVYWYFTFVREYYLNNIPKNFEPRGFLGLWGSARFDAPNIIPDQSVHTTGVTYFPAGDNLSIGVQVKNILDTNVYDNFRIQNAGRSFHLKLTYNIRSTNL